MEDAITKVIKLIANLCTDEESAQRDLIEISKANLLEEFFMNLMTAVGARQIDKSDEFILNVISCTTNIIFYDNSQINLLSENTRIQLF